MKTAYQRANEYAASQLKTLYELCEQKNEEVVEGYRAGLDGWPVNQGASFAWRWGHQNGVTDRTNGTPSEAQQRFARYCAERRAEV